MRKADAAASVLSLVTSHDRADSMVGDLLEGDGAGNRWLFWWAVARTALSQFWRQVAAAPFGMTRTAILGMFVEFSFMLLAAVASAVMLLCAESVLHVSFHRDLSDGPFRWLPFLLYSLGVPFALGRWMFRRCPGREAVGTLTLGVLHASINLCAGWIMWQAARAGNEAHVDITVFVRIVDWNGDIVHMLAWVAYYLTLYQAIVLAGALSGRAKSLEARGL